MVNFQQTFVISNPGNVANAWEGELYCVPDPTMPMSHYTREGATGAYAMEPNTTLGATIGAAITFWSTSFEKWRLAYYGVTVYLDAPALANQGSVVACQYPCIPTIQSLTGPATQVGLATPSHLVVRYQAEDTPSYETITPSITLVLSHSRAFLVRLVCVLWSEWVMNVWYSQELHTPLSSRCHPLSILWRSPPTS
jgi:hypothetical protein